MHGGMFFCMAAMCGIILQCGDLQCQGSIAGLRTFTGTAKVFVVYSMATPRLPPAPLMPQNRSGWLVADIVWRTAFLSALRVTQRSPNLPHDASWHWRYFTPALCR